MQAQKLIVIGGGGGPMAGVELHKKIIQNTLNGGTDQGHLEVLHLSRSHDIADRTAFLLGRSRVDPAEGMFRTMQIAARAAEVAGKEAVAGIPCSTFHAPAIFTHFMQLMEAGGIGMKVVHMIEETAGLIPQLAPNARKIGVMSTAGTRAARVYNEPWNRAATRSSRCLRTWPPSSTTRSTTWNGA